VSRCRMMGDPPRAGEAKLRIRGSGDPHELDVVVVDEHGAERRLVGVVAVALEWGIVAGHIEQSASVSVIEAEVDVVVADGTVKPAVIP
jgi:hypothetical protein